MSVHLWAYQQSLFGLNLLFFPLNYFHLLWGFMTIVSFVCSILVESLFWWQSYIHYYTIHSILMFSSCTLYTFMFTYTHFTLSPHTYLSILICIYRGTHVHTHTHMLYTHTIYCFFPPFFLLDIQLLLLLLFLITLFPTYAFLFFTYTHWVGVVTKSNFPLGMNKGFWCVKPILFSVHFSSPCDLLS